MFNGPMKTEFHTQTISIFRSQTLSLKVFALTNLRDKESKDLRDVIFYDFILFLNLIRLLEQ